MKVNGLEFKRFTVFYRCKGVEKLVNALKNLEKASVDQKTIDLLAEKILDSFGRRFSFELKVVLDYNGFKFEFENVRFNFKVVDNPDYFAVSTSPKNVNVVANLKRDYNFVINLVRKISDHLKESLNIKNFQEFFDYEAVRNVFNERIATFSEFKLVEIIRDFVEVVLKDYEDRMIIARSCDALKYLRRFRGIVFVTNCPSLLDEILKRIELSKLSGRELRKIGYSKEDVINPEEIAIHMLKVIG